jgi:hypothetical protein
VKRKVIIIGMLAAALTAGSRPASPALGRLIHSAQNFRHYFKDLKQGDTSLNPVERFVFSLVLANSKTPEKAAVGEAHVIGRT